MLFVIGDIVTTIYGIQAGATEANSFVATLLETKYGIFIWFILKLSAIGLICYLKTKLKNYRFYNFTWKIIQIEVLGIGLFFTVNNSLVIFTEYDIIKICAMCQAMF